MFHKHDWKIISKTFAPPITHGIEVERMSEDFMNKLVHGVTTILWECQDKNCKQIRKEEMLGKETK